jgi:RNA:NAD 2'-phosphotransferase (TPT1/KptA family)
VAWRRGCEAPVILTVDAAAMHAAGHAFYQAANGVWLTDHVPPGYLSGWPARSSADCDLCQERLVGRTSCDRLR